MALRAKFGIPYGKHMGFRDIMLKIIAFGLKIIGIRDEILLNFRLLGVKCS
jgi:hypothetical protein